MIDGVDHDTGLKRGTDYYICAADDYNLSRPGTKVRTQPPIVEKATVSVTTSVLGLTSTGGGPKVSEEFARCGRKSVIIQGRFWPNLPQVPLQGDTRYRLEAWMKVVPWTHEQRKTAEEKERAWIEKQRSQGKEAEDFKGFGGPRAYITGHLYESGIGILPMIWKTRAGCPCYMDDFSLMPIDSTLPTALSGGSGSSSSKSRHPTRFCSTNLYR